jgi:ketosteroid isomerase-like protein
MVRGPEDELIRLEQARCAAISAADVAALSRLLADELTHTHATGDVEDKWAYLQRLPGRPRTTVRGDDLRVRLYGDIAVMTGTVRNSFPPESEGGPVETEFHALQVWAKGPDGWQQVAFAASGQS